MAQITEGARTSWANTHPLLTQYYDEEWGMPIRDERGVFERLTLEVFQGGLSWLTVLRKRDAFRQAFRGFDVDTVASFDESDVAQLLENAEIIRNRRKIEATIVNAKAAIALRASDVGGLANLVWAHMPEASPCTDDERKLPTTTPESHKLAGALKQHGFSLVGPTTGLAMMAAMGVVDLHIRGSHRRGCSGLWSIEGERLS